MNQLYLHFRRIGIFPVDIAVNWILGFFVLDLKMTSVFCLLDRIMGYDSLYLLPLLSLAVFKHFERNLLEAEKLQEVNEILERKKEINIIEVINNFLFL